MGGGGATGGLTHSSAGRQVAARVWTVRVAEVGVVVRLLRIARVDVGLVGGQPGRLVEFPCQAVLVVVVDAPDLVHAERAVGKRAVDDAVGPVGRVHAVGAEAVLVGAPDRGLLDGAVELKVALFVPVRLRPGVSALVLEEHLVDTDEQTVPWKEGSGSKKARLAK